MAFKTSTKKKRAVAAPKEGTAVPTARSQWAELRAAVKAKTKETLAAPEFTHRLETGYTFLDVNLGWTPEHPECGLIGGRLTLVHGKEGGLKSSFLYRLGAVAQAAGGFFWLANPEESWNPEVAAIQGLSEDPTQFMYTCPESIEEWLMTLDQFLGGGIAHVDVPIVIGLDTLAGLSSKKETEETVLHAGLPMGTPGKLAQYLRSTRELKRLTGRPIYIVILQQHRDALGGGGFNGPAEKVPGGRALRHWISASIEMDLLTKTQAADDHGITLMKEQKHNKKFIDISKFTFVKNRAEIGGRECAIPYFYKSGWHDGIACFDYLFHTGYLEKRGNYIVIDGKSQLRMEWYKDLLADPALLKNIRALARTAYYQENFTDDVHDLKELINGSL